MAKVKALAGHPAEELAQLCFSKLRFYSVALKDDLRRQGLWEDLAQEIYCVALEAWADGKTVQDMGAIGTRCLRRFFKAYGYVRRQRNGQWYGPESWLRLEVAASIFESKLDGHDPWERILSNRAPVPTPAVGRRGHPPNYKPRDVESVTREILERLKAHPEGLTRHDLVVGFRNRVKVQPITACCDRLVAQGAVKEIPRRGRGHPSPLLVFLCRTE